MNRVFAVLTCLCLCGGCSTHDPETSKPSQLTITARVTSYEIANEWDHFDDGSFATFDRIGLRVISPSEHSGTTLAYTVSPSQIAEDSPLRLSGTLLKITVPKSHLSESNLQWGAVADLVIVAPAHP